MPSVYRIGRSAGDAGEGLGEAAAVPGHLESELSHSPDQSRPDGR